MKSKTVIQIRLEDVKKWIRDAKEMGLKVTPLESAQVVLEWVLDEG